MAASVGAVGPQSRAFASSSSSDSSGVQSSSPVTSITNPVFGDYLKGYTGSCLTSDRVQQDGLLFSPQKELLETVRELSKEIDSLKNKLMEGQRKKQNAGTFAKVSGSLIQLKKIEGQLSEQKQVSSELKVSRRIQEILRQTSADHGLSQKEVNELLRKITPGVTVEELHLKCVAFSKFLEFVTNFVTALNKHEAQINSQSSVIEATTKDEIDFPALEKMLEKETKEREGLLIAAEMIDIAGATFDQDIKGIIQEVQAMWGSDATSSSAKEFFIKAAVLNHTNSTDQFQIKERTMGLVNLLINKRKQLEIDWSKLTPIWESTKTKLRKMGRIVETKNVLPKLLPKEMSYEGKNYVVPTFHFGTLDQTPDAIQRKIEVAKARQGNKTESSSGFLSYVTSLFSWGQAASSEPVATEPVKAEAFARAESPEAQTEADGIQAELPKEKSA